MIDLDVRTPEGEAWDNFRQRVIDYMQMPVFDGLERIGPNASISEVDSFAGLIYDSVLLWAYGVNRTLEKGHAPDDGIEFIKNVINFSFEGITGSVTMDEYGDRQMDYIIRMYQNGSTTIMSYYKANLNEVVKVYKADQPSDWSGLMWPGHSSDVPVSKPGCGMDSEQCGLKTQRSEAILSLGVAASLVLALSTAGLFILRKHRFEKNLQEARSCIVSLSDVEVINSKENGHREGKPSRGQSEVIQQFCKVVRLKSEMVAVKDLENTKVNINDRQTLLELKIMKEINHENLNTFIGICLESPNVSILMKYAPRGSLQDILQNDNTFLSLDFKVSLATDIARGMSYIHNSVLGFHGHLTSSNCVVDSRWVCKIDDYGFHHVKSSRSPGGNKEKCTPDDLLWTAPELLEQGIVSSDWIDLMTSCWSDLPNERPTFAQVLLSMQKINGGESDSLVDSMVKRLEIHSTQLEITVAQRTMALSEEKEKVELLVQELLPKTIVESLKLGRTVKPEMYDTSTIFFSDVVSFTRISAAGTPLDVVKMLNMMYTVFDDIAAKYDVYKVATIGDAYFTVSGVPTRNGTRHASEISSMAIDLLSAVSNLPIPHLPGETLKLRIGIHTGPCLAGVVGVKMPRHLLFGDTVDIASQMESSGRSMQIQVSQSTTAILPKESFTLEKRQDPVEIKGYGEMTSYWLL